MNAKELRDWFTGPSPISDMDAEDKRTILRALSLLAAAEANVATPETDAVRDFTWRCEHHPEHQEGMVTTRMIEARLFEEADELRDFARRLERERNGLARARADVLEENARLRAELAKLRANRDFWMESCKQAQQHRDGANEQLAIVEAELAKLRQMVAQQAEDDGLWFNAATAPEAYLQQELRKLHAAVEETK